MSAPAPSDGSTLTAAGEADELHPRHLFRYLGGSEWAEYRAILAVFADTFFTDFSPAEVHARLDISDLSVEPGLSVGSGLSIDTVQDRLESLRRWGNLTVSSSVGNPTSIEDYYRKRNRYLITRAGQQVHDLVERMLANAEEMSDLQPGRLRDLLSHLRSLADHAATGFARLTAEEASTAARCLLAHSGCCATSSVPLRTAPRPAMAEGLSAAMAFDASCVDATATRLRFGAPTGCSLCTTSS